MAKRSGKTEEETIGNQAFVLAIMGSRFSNTQRQSGRIRRSVYDGFHIGPECYFTTGAWGYAFAFFVGGSYLAVESFLCFQASVPFRATQRVQTIASTFLCFSSDPSERITRTDSVCWLLSRGSICLYETRSSAWMLTLPV